MPAHPVENKVGMRFGRLVVEKYVGNSQWLCLCDCGNRTTVYTSALNRGATQSCGCLHVERASEANATHGKSRTRLYRVWAGMKERCLNSNATNYSSYGGRGIGVCDEWRDSYEEFEKWAMASGYDPSAKFSECSLDRIDNDRDYCPDNCRWVTYAKQAQNRRKCQKPNLWRPVEMIDDSGSVIKRYTSVKQAAADTGIPRQQISSACNGRIKTTHGTRWRHAQIDEEASCETSDISEMSDVSS